MNSYIDDSASKRKGMRVNCGTLRPHGRPHGLPRFAMWFLFSETILPLAISDSNSARKARRVTHVPRAFHFETILCPAEFEIEFDPSKTPVHHPHQFSAHFLCGNYCFWVSSAAGSQLLFWHCCSYKMYALAFSGPIREGI